MDSTIALEFTDDEARVLLVAVLHALQGKTCHLLKAGELEAANAAAAKLQNSLAQRAQKP